MDIDFYVINGGLALIGAFLVLKRFKHVGLCLAGLSLIAGCAGAMYDEQWWPTLAGLVCAVILGKGIGNPLEP